MLHCYIDTDRLSSAGPIIIARHTDTGLMSLVNPCYKNSTDRSSMTIAEVCEESIQHLSIHVHPGIPMAYTPFYIQQSQICILTEGAKKLRTFIQQGSPLYTAPRYRLHTLLTLWQGGKKVLEPQESNSVSFQHLFACTSYSGDWGRNYKKNMKRCNDTQCIREACVQSVLRACAQIYSHTCIIQTYT